MKVYTNMQQVLVDIKSGVLKDKRIVIADEGKTRVGKSHMALEIVKYLEKQK